MKRFTPHKQFIKKKNNNIQKKYIRMTNLNECNICNERSDSIGWHYGVVTCQACKVNIFF